MNTNKIKTINLIILLIFAFFNSSGQITRKINGYFVDERYNSLPYISIYNSDSVLLGETDIDGKITITIPIDMQRLRINYIGFKTTIIDVPSDCNNLDVILLVLVNYDFISNRKVNRKERRRFQKLPKLHKKAYKLGLFKSETPCYIRPWPGKWL